MRSSFTRALSACAPNAPARPHVSVHESIHGQRMDAHTNTQIGRQTHQRAQRSRPRAQRASTTRTRTARPLQSSSFACLDLLLSLTRYVSDCRLSDYASPPPIKALAPLIARSLDDHGPPLMHVHGATSNGSCSSCRAAYSTRNTTRGASHSATCCCCASMVVRTASESLSARLRSRVQQSATRNDASDTHWTSASADALAPTPSSSSGGAVAAAAAPVQHGAKVRRTCV